MLYLFGVPPKTLASISLLTQECPHSSTKSNPCVGPADAKSLRNRRRMAESQKAKPSFVASVSLSVQQGRAWSMHKLIQEVPFVPESPRRVQHQEKLLDQENQQKLQDAAPERRCRAW